MSRHSDLIESFQHIGGKLFYRLVHQAVSITPKPYDELVNPLT